LKISPDTSLPLIESNQQNSNMTENLPDDEKCGSFQISTIVDMRFVFGEQYAKVSFKGIHFVKIFKF
jgi:hypothetical protein